MPLCLARALRLWPTQLSWTWRRQSRTISGYTYFPRPGIEDCESYIPGGFHPIHLGDVLHSRYRIVHKLGYGGFSTVWLARDALLNRYVSAKILRADFYKGNNELEKVDKLLRNIPSHSGAIHIAPFIDTFRHQGPNGEHLVLISAVRGPSVSQVLAFGGHGLDPSSARKTGLQCAEALAAMHAGGIVHGDFRTGNLLYGLKNIDSWTEEQIFANLGKPQELDLDPLSGGPRSASAPRYVLNPASMQELPADFVTKQIHVIDFGESFDISSPPLNGVGTPLSLMAPELYFDKDASFASDVWALGCLLYEIRAGRPLFYPFFDTDDEYLVEVVQTLGRLPDRWWQAWEERGNYFKEDGTAREYSGEGLQVFVASIRERVRDIGISPPPPD